MKRGMAEQRDPRDRRRGRHPDAAARACSSAPGYAVEEAEDGRAGLRAFYGSAPDLVILDVTMPELDGWATLERIRDLSDVPVMMLTARGSELERVRGLTHGADDYVEKPFGRQELLARVQALLRRAGGGGRRSRSATPTASSRSTTPTGAVSVETGPSR